MSNLGAARHLGFDRKWIITSLRLPESIMHQQVKFQHNLTMCDGVIDDFANVFSSILGVIPIPTPQREVD